MTAEERYFKSTEKELDELRNKLRKQRTTDNLSNNQEITRLEKDLEKDFRLKVIYMKFSPSGSFIIIYF